MGQSLLSIINIVLDNPELLKENIVYIENIVINFCNLICDKQNMLLSNKIFDYENEYEEFLRFHNNQQEIFYNNLSEIKKDYDELIVDVTNILW